MYEFIDGSISKLKRRTQIAFNNSRLELLKSDELNLLQVKKETNRLYKKLREESEKFLKELLEDLSDRLHFNKDEFPLEYFLEAISPVLLYSFNTETERKKSRHFESIVAISDMSDPKALEEQKKETRYWNTQVEETAVDIEREVFIQSAKKRGVKKVQWITREDGKVCEYCGDLDGKVFEIDNIPHRPHIGCRCWLKEVV